MTERLRSIAPLVVIVVAATVAVQMVPGGFRVVVFIGAVGAIVALRSWPTRDDRTYGPGSHGGPK